MSCGRILLVEDEPGLVMTISDLLKADGYTVDHAGDFVSGAVCMKAGGHDLVILDLMLPGGSGLDLLRDMRSAGNATPVLVLTARATVPERVIGLKLGADDYLGKPFDSMELLARVEAVIRRDRSSGNGTTAAGNGSSGEGGGSGNRPEVFRFGDLELDISRSEARKAGTAICLTVQEYRLLAFLVAHPGRTLSRERLLDEVWGYGSGVSSRTVDVHVSSLRQKIGDDPALPRWIITVRGFGYRFEP
jgi:two-component system, OmpR family, alkaline phosphatase synthesis response regulator PhoP